MANKRVYTGFDLIKLLAAICIIAIHTKAPFLNIIGRLGVPFFAIVSSILFFNHYQQLTTDEEQSRYLKKFCKRIFLLYISWQVLYIPIAIRQFRVIISSLGGVSIKNLLIYLCDFIFPAIYNSKGVDITQDANGWGPSWYLLASIIAMSVLIYLFRLFNQQIRWVFLFCLLIEIYLVLADEFSPWTHLNPIFNHTFLRLLIYFCLGYIIVNYRSQITTWNTKVLNRILILFIFIFIIENLLVHYYSGTYNTEEVITTVPTGFLLAVFAAKIKPNLHYSAQIRHLSTFLYCFQIWPIVIMRKLFKIIGWEKHYLLLFIIVLIISFGIAFLYEQCRQRYKWKFLKYLI